MEEKEKTARKWRKESKWRQIGQLQNQGNEEEIEVINQIKISLLQKLDEDELKWKQRTKQHWLKNGDRNKKFYHLYANQRKKNNRISLLMESGGRIAQTQSKICSIFSTFFPNCSLPQIPWRQTTIFSTFNLELMLTKTEISQKSLLIRKSKKPST